MNNDKSMLEIDVDQVLESIGRRSVTGPARSLDSKEQIYVTLCSGGVKPEMTAPPALFLSPTLAYESYISELKKFVKSATTVEWRVLPHWEEVRVEGELYYYIRSRLTARAEQDA